MVDKGHSIYPFTHSPIHLFTYSPIHAHSPPGMWNTSSPYKHWMKLIWPQW